jgi:hypothetical protein
LLKTFISKAKQNKTKKKKSLSVEATYPNMYLYMDKLLLKGQNLSRVLNSKKRPWHAKQLHFSETEQTNLELKTQPKQLLGSLPLDIALPDLYNKTFITEINSKMK